jgi:hypothetical protein
MRIFKNMRVSGIKGFWSPRQASALIILIERIISLVGKIYKFVDFVCGRGGFSYSFPF